MRTCRFLLGAIVILAMVAALQSRAANNPGADHAAPAKAAPGKPAQANSPGKVWSNPDLNSLPAEVQLSLVGPYPSEAPLPPAPVGSQAAPLAPASETAPGSPSEAAPYDRYRDPVWYAEQADQLQTELALTEAGLRSSANRVAQAEDRDTQPGINLDRGNVGVTPQEGVAILEQRAHDVQNQIDELNDLARHNGIAPGVLR